MPEGTTYTFLPVFKESQLDKLKKVEILTKSLVNLIDSNVYTPQMAAQEIRQFSKQTGFGTNIVDKIIAQIPDTFAKDLQKELQESKVEEKEVKKEKVNDERTIKDEKVVKYSFKNKG
jgi:hypothetical protein